MSEDIRHQLGEAIRTLRTQKGWSQEQFAEVTGLHRTYVSAIERGTRNVSLDNIARVSAALRMPVSELFAAAEKSETED